MLGALLVAPAPTIVPHMLGLGLGFPPGAMSEAYKTVLSCLLLMFFPHPQSRCQRDKFLLSSRPAACTSLQLMPSEKQ